METDWPWIERMAARHDGLPWHVYRGLSSGDRAQVLANFQEHSLREAVYAKRLKAKESKEASMPTLGVEDYL